MDEVATPVVRRDRGAVAAGPRQRLRGVVPALCLTQIVGWGVLYYAFPVLASSISTDAGWSRTEVTAAFSAGLLVSALAGIPVGRWIHRHGPRGVMTWGAVLGVLSLVAVATAHNFAVFLAAWLVAGLAMGATLYSPAFAAITVWFGPDRVRALTAVTLIAGLASTVFAPLSASLNDHLGWRETYLVLAAVLAVVVVPAHWVALKPEWPPAPETAAADPIDHELVVSRREFVVLAAGFTLAATAFYAALIDIVPIVQARGFSTRDAAWVLGVGGIGQVMGRLAYDRLTRALDVRARTVAVLAFGAVTTVLLGVIRTPLIALVVASLLAGSARGIFTLLEATAVSDRWGTARFARLNGVFAAPLVVATAVAPFVGAGLADLLGGYDKTYVILAAAGLAAAWLAGMPHQRPGRPRSPQGPQKVRKGAGTSES